MVLQFVMLGLDDVWMAMFGVELIGIWDFVSVIWISNVMTKRTALRWYVNENCRFKDHVDKKRWNLEKNEVKWCYS